MILRSIRSKLTLWYTCVLALVLTVFALLIYTVLVRALAQQTDRNISEVTSNVTAAVQSEHEDGDERFRSAEDTIREALDEFHSVDYSFVVTAADGHVIANTSHVTLDPSAGFQDQFFTVRADRRPFRVGRFELSVGDAKYHLFVVYSLEDQRELEETVRNILFAGIPLFLLVAAAGGFFLARRTLRPIGIMSGQARKITADNLHERLPIKNPNDELGSLAISFNEVLDRLDREFERQRRFMADASHELRTPLAIVRGESDVALLQDKRTPEEYKESLRIVNDESTRLTKIVDDLFILARADAGGIGAEMRDVYADEILADCLVSVRTLADSRSISINSTTAELPVVGDEGLLRRLFLNLLDNAIKYNYYGGVMEVSVNGTAVEIANTGARIPDEQVGLIFERFYRSQKERPADGSITSGSGLGLAISKLIAELHGARIDYSHAGVMNIFTVTFPAITSS